ncbi:MAG: acyl-CoA thioesterase [Acidimicrobiales bacterium]
MTAMAAVDELIDLLDLEAIEVNVFRGRSPDDKRQRVFGGQVAGQALVAAGRTVDAERPVHSLHAYFLRPGDPTVPILYEVDRIRDGRSFTTRRVVAIQHGKVIFNLAASFHIAEEGLDHQLPMPPAPPPESLPTFAERMEPYRTQLGEWYTRPLPIDMRHVGEPPHVTGGRDPRPPCQQVWIRADGALPDDPLLHACVVTYASDMTLLDSILLAHGTSWLDPELMGASLDHAMWFHRPFRADEWLLYDQESASAHGARGLGQGRIYTEGGAHVVSVVQEGLFRRRNPGSPGQPSAAS